nr:histidine kinase [Streptomyces aureocirculatus]
MDQHSGGPGPMGSVSPKDTLGRTDGHSSTADLRASAPVSRWLGAVMHTAFFLLLGASLARFLLRHPGEPRTPGIIALSITLAFLYVLAPAPGAAPSTRRPVWLGAVVGAWVVLVVLAPSFAWCAVPLFYTGLRTLPTRAALALVTALTALVVGAQLRLAGSFDPNLAFAPPAVAAVATAVFIHMQRQTEHQRALNDDLMRTRRELAATERREGTLAERQRLSMEIHDTLAQGLSSQQMLLQAADRVWDADPATARAHVRTAVTITEHGLAEARRFVHDLAPADLAEAATNDGEALPSALRALAERETAAGLTIRFHAEGRPVPLPGRAQSALLRIAQGALANVREHADASAAALTLTYLDDQVVLDIADNGRGFVVKEGGRGGAATGGDQVPTDLRAGQEVAVSREEVSIRKEEVGDVDERDGGMRGPSDTGDSPWAPIADDGHESTDAATSHGAATTEADNGYDHAHDLDLDLDHNGGHVHSHAHGPTAPHTSPSPSPASRDAGRGPSTDARRRPIAARDLDSGSRRGHGLPAIHARARQLGGTLTVESTLGEGTVLSVSIPLAAAPPPATGAPPPSPTPTTPQSPTAAPASTPTSTSTPTSPTPPVPSSPATPPQSEPSPDEWPPSGSTHEQ